MFGNEKKRIMKRAILLILIVLLVVSCKGKKETGTISDSENVTANSSGDSSVTEKEGTPAPASDFDFNLGMGYDGVQVILINDYKGKAKNLTIPTDIEDFPIYAVYISTSNPNVEQVFVPEGVVNVSFKFPNLRAVSLPSTLKNISEGSFKGCRNLKSILIPSGVTFISNELFMDTSFQSFSIPSFITSLGTNAFRDCKNLTTVEISSDILREVRHPFVGCDNLKNIILNEEVEGIGWEVFKDLKSLETIKLPKSLTFIGEKAFSNTGLTEITIPKTDELLTIYKDAFSNCENLVTVNFEEGAKVKFLIGGAFSDCPKLSLKSKSAIMKVMSESD